MAACASIVLVLLIERCLPAFAGPLQGRVIDKETGQPIADAAVVATWCYDTVRMDGGPRFLQARESVTGADGQFSISGGMGVLLNPFSSRLPVVFTVFRPGYSQCSGAREGDCAPPTIRLHRLSSEEREKRRFAGNDIGHDLRAGEDPYFCVYLPERSVPNLTRLVHAEDTYYGTPFRHHLDESEIVRLWRIVLFKSVSDPVPEPVVPPTPIPIPSHPGMVIQAYPSAPGVKYYGPPSGYGKAKVSLQKDNRIDLSLGDVVPGIGTLVDVSKQYIDFESCEPKPLIVITALHGLKPFCKRFRIAVEPPDPLDPATEKLKVVQLPNGLQVFAYQGPYGFRVEGWNKVHLTEGASPSTPLEGPRPELRARRFDTIEELTKAVLGEFRPERSEGISQPEVNKNGPGFLVLPYEQGGAAR